MPQVQSNTLGSDAHDSHALDRLSAGNAGYCAGLIAGLLFGTSVFQHLD